MPAELFASLAPTPLAERLRPKALGDILGLPCSVIDNALRNYIRHHPDQHYIPVHHPERI